MQAKIRSIYADIEKVARNQPVDVIPQVLAALSFIRLVYPLPHVFLIQPYTVSFFVLCVGVVP